MLFVMMPRQQQQTTAEDGTRVIVFRMGWVESMAVCWYDGEQMAWRPVDGFVFHSPTHWMPLPPAPAATASAPTTGSQR